VAEQFNRTIVEMLQTMRINSNLSRGFWAKALQLAVHIYNQIPHKANGGKSPYFALTGEQPKLDKYLHPFGTKVYTKIQTKQNKLLPKSRPGMYMGPADKTSSYRIYVLDTNSVSCTQDFAFFDETSTIQVHEEPILDFSNLPSSRPTVQQEPPTPVPQDDAVFVGHYVGWC